MADPYTPRRTTKIKNFANFKGRLKHTRVETKLQEFKDAAFLDIRQHETHDEGDTWQHTQTGLSIHVADLPVLLKAVKKAMRKSKELGYDTKFAREPKKKKEKRK